MCRALQANSPLGVTKIASSRVGELIVRPDESRNEQGRYETVRRKSQAQITATMAASTGRPQPSTPTSASTKPTTATVPAALPAITSW
jgi:hypothetical protein